MLIDFRPWLVWLGGSTDCHRAHPGGLRIGGAQVNNLPPPKWPTFVDFMTILMVAVTVLVAMAPLVVPK